MRPKIIFLITSLLLSCLAAGAQDPDREINDLINSGDYLTLARRYTAVQDSLHPTVKLLAEGFINAAFNRPDEACEALGALASGHQEILGLGGITAILVTMCENLRYVGKFGEAAAVTGSLLDQTAAFDGLDSLSRSSLAALLPLGKLGDRPPIIERPDRDCEIPVIMGEGGLDLPTIRARLNGSDVYFVFDSGCEGHATNFVSEGFARRNGIRILDDSVTVRGGIGSLEYVKLGLADSMRIGDIIYRNVRFTIAPGENVLPVDSISIDAVLGSVFMKAVGEIQFYPHENRIVFPARQTAMPESGPNMMLLGGQPFIELHSGEERLLMHLDTGGGITLSDAYYRRHRQEVESAGTLRTDGGVGSFGGMKKIDMYVLPSFPLRAGGKTVEARNVNVHTESAQMLQNPVIDGMVGYDFIRLFDKVTVNFDNMFVIAE